MLHYIIMLKSLEHIYVAQAQCAAPRPQMRNDLNDE